VVEGKMIVLLSEILSEIGLRAGSCMIIQPCSWRRHKPAMFGVESKH